MTPTLQVPDRHLSRPMANTIWIVLAFLACASVLLLNGRPLFYYDTVGYVDQGRVALKQLGLIHPTGSGALGQAGSETGHTVDGSRSPSYSLFAGVFAQAGVLEALLAMSAGALFLAVWLLARVAVRVFAPGASIAASACLPLIVAGFGSLPFYIAYLMPDILAPVMILAIATVTAFGRDMRVWELLLAFALAAFAVVSHLSHFAIAGLMLLAALLISVLMARRHWWLAPLMVVAVLGTAYLQQKAFRVVAQNAANSEVVIKPYITARLIQDGPGLRYLESHCPNADMPTCALYEALGWSDNPWRLTATHIVFETSKDLGSFRLMTEENQKRVADAQVGFFLDVLMDMPVATSLAFLNNTIIQSSMTSIDMTLPSDLVEQSNARVTGVLSGQLTHGRLVETGGWFVPLMQFQRVFYLVALAVIVTLLVLPGRVPVRVKAFAVMIILGILANALVCGGISQPATRYGARMIWLLPFTATFMLYWAMQAGRLSKFGGRS